MGSRHHGDLGLSARNLVVAGILYAQVRPYSGIQKEQNCPFGDDALVGFRIHADCSSSSIVRRLNFTFIFRSSHPRAEKRLDECFRRFI